MISHHIFKEIFDSQSLLIKNERILDFVFLERDDFKRGDFYLIISPAQLIMATNRVIIFAEEAFEEIKEEYLGYKIKYIYYDEISSFELDLSSQAGKFKISSNSCQQPELLLEFNLQKYYQDFEQFIDSARKERSNYNIS